jgi:hypothetical protein
MRAGDLPLGFSGFCNYLPAFAADAAASALLVLHSGIKSANEVAQIADLKQFAEGGVPNR